jgi:hypothetical protein
VLTVISKDSGKVVTSIQREQKKKYLPSCTLQTCPYTDIDLLVLGERGRQLYWNEAHSDLVLGCSLLTDIHASEGIL